MIRDNNNREDNKRIILGRFRWVNLFLLASTELLGGLTFSLLSPFYTEEASLKGISVFQTGLVYSVAFLATLLTAPIFGKYLVSIGSKPLLVYGSFLSGATNVLFGFLQWVDSPGQFLGLSLAIRIASAVGEAAFFAAIYPLAVQSSNPTYRSTVLSVMETMFGVGLMIGPFFGGVLYEINGFGLPFFVCGGGLVLCSFASAIMFESATEEVCNNEEESTRRPTFARLLKIPKIIYLSCTLCVTGISVSWYLPSLQPFLERHFHLSALWIGAMFMLDGATYALFSPLWGWILDTKRVSPMAALFCGNVCIILGYFILGPMPYYGLSPQSVYITAGAMCIHGFGVAANFITTLTSMMSCSVQEGGFPDSEQTRGLVSSVWFFNECLGGYLGSAGGGFAFDKLGFEKGALIVMGLQAVVLLLMPCFLCTRRSRLTVQEQEERTRLIDNRVVV